MNIKRKYRAKQEKKKSKSARKKGRKRKSLRFKSYAKSRLNIQKKMARRAGVYRIAGLKYDLSDESDDEKQYINITYLLTRTFSRGDRRNSCNESKKHSSLAKQDHQNSKILTTSIDMSVNGSHYIADELAIASISADRRPDRIVCLFNNAGKWCFLVKWCGTNRCDVCDSSQVKQLWPQLVIEFYQKHLNFNV